MSSTREDKQSRDPVSFNMTPMIDVVFLLIIFFMLVSTFASAENIPLDLPKPENSQAKNVKLPDRVVINCKPANPADPRSGVVYSVGPNRAENLAVIAERLAAAKAAYPNTRAVIRADKRLPYAAVREVMRTVADAGIEAMNLVAHVGTAERVER